MALPTALLVKGGIGATTVALGGVAIAKKEDIYYLFNPNNNRKLNKIIKALGISGCELENGKTSKTCTLDTDKLKKVKFTKDATDLTATGENISTELTIEKLGDDFKTDFPEGLRFTLKNTNATTDLEIGTDSNKKITLKAGVSYDFKIKTVGSETKLEKAWTLTTLAAKVGLNCAEDTATECSLNDNKTINVWKDETDYITGAKGETSKKMCVNKDQKDYLEGLKFTVSADTTLTEGEKMKTTGGIEKLTQNSTNSTNYEIALKDLGDNKGKKWFLVEKSTPAA